MTTYSRIDNKNEQIELTSNVLDDSSENSTQSSNNPTQFSLTSLFNTIDLFIINQYVTFKESFKSLETCPKELYVNFFLKFCESYGYFSISQILVIYLHDEFHVSDIQAGAIYGIWGACITFWGLSISWLNDNFGVRNSLLMGFTIQAISSVIIASARSIVTIYIVLFLIMPIGTAMGIPMLTVGIKRYTNNVNRGFAFGLYYSVMNIAAFVSGPVVDLCNIGLKGGFSLEYISYLYVITTYSNMNISFTLYMHILMIISSSMIIRDHCIWNALEWESFSDINYYYHLPHLTNCHI